MFNNIYSCRYLNNNDLNLNFKNLFKENEKSLDIIKYHEFRNEVIVLNKIFVLSSIFNLDSLQKDFKENIDNYFSILSVRNRPQLYPDFKEIENGSVFNDESLAVLTQVQDNVDEFIISSSERLIVLLNQTMNSISSLYSSEYEAFLPIVNKLNNIMSSLPSISEEEILELNQLIKEMHDTMVQQNLPISFRSSFWNSIENTYTEIINNSKSLSSNITQNLQQSQNQLDLFKQVQTSVSEFLLMVSPGDFQNSLTVTDASRMLQLLLFIGNVFDSLDKSEQNLINNTLFPTINRECYNNYTLGNVLADMWAYNIISVCLSEDPKITQLELQNKIINKVSSYENSSFFPIKNMVNFVLNIVYSQGQGTVGNIYSISSNGELSMDSQLLNSIINSPGYINHSSLPSLEANQNSSIVFNLEANQIISLDTINMNAIQKSAIQLTEFIAVQTEGLNNSRGQALFFLPLPSAIASVLLKHYMPEEIAFLQKLSDNLYYSNMGSKVEGSILENISSYINSGSFFNLASTIGNPITTNGKTSFSGDTASMQKRLQTELQETKHYITITQQALTTLEQQISVVQGDDKLSSNEKSQLIGSLNLNKNNLNNILNNLIAAQSLLSQLKIVSNGDANSGSFLVNGPANWQADLQNLETNLVSGTNGQGGMFSTITNLQAAQQSFADEGQNKQLELQLHLTTMQQEWTVIATSLQILNQIYLGLARNIIQ